MTLITYLPFDDFFFFNNPLSDEQRYALRTRLHENEYNTLSDLVIEGHELSSWVLDEAYKREESYSQIFKIKSKPTVWPINLINSLYPHLNASVKERIKDMEIGLICSNDINALAWPSGIIGINVGLGSFFYSIAQASFWPLIKRFYGPFPEEARALCFI